MRGISWLTTSSKAGANSTVGTAIVDWLYHSLPKTLPRTYSLSLLLFCAYYKQLERVLHRALTIYDCTHTIVRIESPNNYT